MTLSELADIGELERATSSQLMAFPGFRIWWRQTRSTFSPAFVGRMAPSAEPVG